MIRTVYVAGPYSGDTDANIAKALFYADQLLEVGYVPYVPHLSHYWNLEYSHDYETWMGQCLEWVARCDALVRVPGKSPGADREVEHANYLNIPVFYTLQELYEYKPKEEYWNYPTPVIECDGKTACRGVNFKTRG